MTEKRFTIKADGINQYNVSDSQDEFPMPITDLKSCEFICKALNNLNDEIEQLKQYKQAVTDILLNWSQKNLTAEQLQVVIAIMEELGVEIE